MWRGQISPDGENLEERLRRMAVSNSPDHAKVATTQYPVVRLPPPHDTHAPHPYQPPNYEHQTQHTVPQFVPHGRVSTQSHVPSFSGPPAYASESMKNGLPFDFRGYQPSHVRSLPAGGRGGQRSTNQQQLQIDPDAFQRGPQPQHRANQHYRPHRLYDPSMQPVRQMHNARDTYGEQADYLDLIVAKEVPLIEMSEHERAEKESFRQVIEQICHEVCDADPQNLPRVSLECFGSFQSGFASAGSDMDLVIVVTDGKSESACFSLLEHDLPRALEKHLLRHGFGARLLTRTRVPIIKLCQKPGPSLLDKLREERERWDGLHNEKKYPHLYPDEDDTIDGEFQTEEAKPQGDAQSSIGQVETHKEAVPKETTPAVGPSTSTDTTQTNPTSVEKAKRSPPSGQTQHTKQKPWTRQRKAGPLDFPKTGVGIQSDINFFNPLGLHNTQMLRCYSLCDDRVRPMVHLVKAWAKRRQINSSYSGTLSSYGYVLMVLHYLVNVVQPPVLPNLQQPWRPNPNCSAQGASPVKVDGWEVDFWRNEDQIVAAKYAGQMSSNRESLGSLLAGFFHYYSSLGGGNNQFRWVQQVLSLRTQGGILSKESKGWTKATTEKGDGKNIQHRYLFCIEDPFELNHNVARTVTHNGIVAIRDEFRRAHNILTAIGKGMTTFQGDLLDELREQPSPKQLPPDLRTSGATVHDFSAKKKHFDVNDNDAFPSLGAAKQKPKPGSSTQSIGDKDGVISGERARQLLEELKKKKKAEGQA